MKIKNIYIFILGLFFIAGCSNYLDIVPDNIPTIEHAFKNRTQAEKFLFTCYSSLPNHADPVENPGFAAGDEIWLFNKEEIKWYPSLNAAKIARGEQSANDPYLNYWDGRYSGKNLFIGIRNCNILIESISQVTDMNDDEKNRWIAEAKFLKTYFHFFLLRLYGPIPIVDENISINATPEEVRIFREPVDEVVKYICKTIDEAVPDLPSTILLNAEEDGRITKAVALAIKAHALLWAASPLFNGNTEYADFVDKRGKPLVSQQYSSEKWDLARDAAKAAIDEAHQAGHSLYYWNDVNVSQSTKFTMNVCGAVTDPWNNEIIWGATNSTETLQIHSMARFIYGTGGSGARSYHAPPLKMAELFYSENGIPISEDPRYFSKDEWYKLRTTESTDEYYIKKGYTTVKLHFHREPRFYADLAFDGSLWYGNGKLDDKNLGAVEFKKGQAAGVYIGENTNATGYLPKKLVSYKTIVTGTSFTQFQYSFPIIRLADLYLMYAEALNESQGPSNEIYSYLDLIRQRAGLTGVIESWQASINPAKPTSKEGLREIIQHERLIELAFEGSRFYDLRRWKQAANYMNKPVTGWNIYGETAEDFYNITTLHTRTFSRRDYLWPIRENDLFVNTNLVQNPGWN